MGELRHHDERNHPDYNGNGDKKYSNTLANGIEDGASHRKEEMVHSMVSVPSPSKLAPAPIMLNDGNDHSAINEQGQNQMNQSSNSSSSGSDSSEDENLFDLVNGMDVDSVMDGLPGVTDAAAATAQSNALEADLNLLQDLDEMDPDPQPKPVKTQNTEKCIHSVSVHQITKQSDGNKADFASNNNNKVHSESPAESKSPTKPVVSDSVQPLDHNEDLGAEDIEADYDLLGSDSNDIDINGTEAIQTKKEPVPDAVVPEESNLSKADELSVAPLSVINPNTNTMTSMNSVNYLEIMQTPNMLPINAKRGRGPFGKIGKLSPKKLTQKESQKENIQSTHFLPPPPGALAIGKDRENVIDDDNATRFSQFVGTDSATVTSEIPEFSIQHQLEKNPPLKLNASLPQPLFAALDNDESSDGSDSSEDAPLFAAGTDIGGLTGFGAATGVMVQKVNNGGNGGNNYNKNSSEADSEEELLFHELEEPLEPKKSTTDFKHFLSSGAGI